MRKIRGFRLGRRLARVWRWVRRRPHNRAYLRLKPTNHLSPSWSPRRCHPQDDDPKDRTAMATKIAHWGRCLTRHLRPSSRASLGRAAKDEENSERLLAEGPEHLHDWQQQNQEVEAEDESWWKAPPKGHLPVYVGRKDVDPPRRVLVPVIYFNHPLFGELLRGAEEEFDFHHPGGITIPCPISDFESVRTRVAAASGVSCRHSGRPAGPRRWPLTLS